MASVAIAAPLGRPSRASTTWQLHPLEFCAPATTQLFDVTSQMYPSTHSSLATHSVKQARSALAQMYGEQSSVASPAVGQAAPCAAQTAAACTCESSTQIAGAHVFPSTTSTHAPPGPHVDRHELAWLQSLRRSKPVGSIAQTPGDVGSAHEWQGLAHAVSQQT